jgi:hypothetical protein
MTKSVHEIKNKIEKKKVQLRYNKAKRCALRNKDDKLVFDIQYLQKKIDEINSGQTTTTSKQLPPLTFALQYNSE